MTTRFFVCHLDLHTMLMSAPLPVTEATGIGETELELVSDEPVPAVTRGTTSELDFKLPWKLFLFFLLHIWIQQEVVGGLGYR